MRFCSPSWFRDYDRLQSAALLVLHLQIVCSLIGSVGALFNGVLLVNLVVALFALVAVESSNPALGRTYAVLLFSCIVLDVAWFILFSTTIWNMAPNQKFGGLFVFSLKLTLYMEIIGFMLRFFSSCLWIQMYRLGAPTVDGAGHYVAEYDRRNRLPNMPDYEVNTEDFVADEILGGLSYDPDYFSSLFDECCDRGSSNKIADT